MNLRWVHLRVASAREGLASRGGRGARESALRQRWAEKTTSYSVQAKACSKRDAVGRLSWMKGLCHGKSGREAPLLGTGRSVGRDQIESGPGRDVQRIDLAARSLPRSSMMLRASSTFNGLQRRRSMRRRIDRQATADSGRFPRLLLHDRQAVTRLPDSLSPPLLRGVRWSSVISLGRAPRRSFAQ